MSQAFLNGFRASHNMGMGNVRTPQMRSADQARTQSGNPGLAYNMPRFSAPQQQMGGGFTRSPPMQQGMPTDEQIYQAQMSGGNGGSQFANMMGNSGGPPVQYPQMMNALQQFSNGYRAPVMAPRGGPMPPQQAQMPVAAPAYRVPSGPMFTNLNAGRFGRNRPLNQ